MLYLAIESSCDETAAAVVSSPYGKDEFEILSNVIASQIDIHAKFGGVVPEIAGRAHIEAISSLTYKALSDANVTADDIDVVAVTSEPGLIGALLVGVNFAKGFAYANKKPLVRKSHKRPRRRELYKRRYKDAVSRVRRVGRPHVDNPRELIYRF